MLAIGLMPPVMLMRAMRSATPPLTLPTVAWRSTGFFSSGAGAASASAAAATGVGDDKGSLPSGTLAPAAPLMLPRGVLSAAGVGEPSSAVDEKLGDRECSLLRSPLVCTPYMGEGCTVSELRRELDCDPFDCGIPEMLGSRDLRLISESCSC